LRRASGSADREEVDVALLFVDSFDHYTTITQKWTTFVSGSIGAFGANGTNGLRNTGAPATLAKTLPGGSKGTLVCGLNFRTSGTAAVGSPFELVAFRDSGTIQIDVRMKSDNTLQITRNGTVLGTGTTVLSLNV